MLRVVINSKHLRGELKLRSILIAKKSLLSLVGSVGALGDKYMSDLIIGEKLIINVDGKIHDLEFLKHLIEFVRALKYGLFLFTHFFIHSASVASSQTSLELFAYIHPSHILQHNTHHSSHYFHYICTYHSQWY